jgi:hypothetical protein
MPKPDIPLLLVFCCLSACTESARTDLPEPAISPVTADVLFLVLGKMALYDQSPAGEIALRNYHFVAEIMPKEGRQIVSGTLASTTYPAQVLAFEPEGNAFLAHGARVMEAEQLHQLHPDGEYVFSFETQSGRMEAQSLVLAKRSSISEMPAAARVSLAQNGVNVLSSSIDGDSDLALSWTSMPGNTKAANSELEDLIFVLVFDCFGNNVAHSGRPYQGGPYLSYKDSHYVGPARALAPGLAFTAIVEQATADVERFLGVPGIATYATLTFVKFQTSGDAVGVGCPVNSSD